MARRLAERDRRPHRLDESFGVTDFQYVNGNPGRVSQHIQPMLIEIRLFRIHIPVADRPPEPGQGLARRQVRRSRSISVMSVRRASVALQALSYRSHVAAG